MTQFDLAGRIALLTESFGEAGIVVLLLLGVLLVIYLMLRGAGAALLLLLVTYSLIFVEFGGISTAAFFTRILALLLLVLVTVRRLVIPGWTFWAVVAYALLGTVFALSSPNVPFSLQQGGLLLITAVGVPLGVAQYLTSYEKVDRLFRMFAVSGVVWTLASAVFVREFIRGTELRFSAGSGVHATTYAAFGALLLPFMLWVTLRRRHLAWRAAGLIGLFGIPICIFLSGTRTAIVIAAMTCAPIFLRRGLTKTAALWAFGLVLGAGVLFAGRYVLRDRSTEFLTSRITQTGLTGRQHLWAEAFRTCMQSPVLGRGIGSDSLLARGRGSGLFHNAYLAIWCNTGLPGLLLMLGVLGGSIVRAWTLMRRATDPFARDVMRFVFGFLLALAALGMVENSFSSPSNAMIATLLIMVTLVNRMGHLMQQRAALQPALRRAQLQTRRSIRTPGRPFRATRPVT